jgi:hypothetical protein
MPGFLGGSSSTSSGQVTIYPNATLLDPVSKLRVSEPQTMMDTDFEYGLQPTKWETVELINNTPSFFSASGDTTLPNLNDMTTTAGSREIKVTTLLPHGVSVGIPINVTGSKSLTADGSYIINSVPDTTTFTYLCKGNQLTTASIIDLYTSIITGQFFQGSQIKISDSQGLVTDAAASSTLTVTTDSPHGFGVNTPFYFLNLNSTVSQEFDASNTGAKTFDSSNTATAQSFDGSNTLTTYPIDLSNKSNTGVVSTIITSNASTDTITVTHTTENFVGKPVGTPLYYNISAASGYFATTPRGIVFLASTALLGSSSSEFQVSATPGGSVIDLTVTLTGTIQLADRAISFAGNNDSPTAKTDITLIKGSAQTFDGANNLGSVNGTNTTFSNGSALIQVTNNAGSSVSTGLSVGSMVRYSTTGTAAGGLTNNTTYWLTYFNIVVSPAPGLIQIKLTATVGGNEIVISSQGSGVHTFTQIGVSTDKDTIYLPAHGLNTGDMVLYSYPAAGAMTRLSFTKDYMWVTRLDANNIQLESSAAMQVSATVSPTTINVSGQSYKVYTFLSNGTFTITGNGTMDYMVVAGGGSGGSDMGGGGGAGGYLAASNVAVSSGTATVTVGLGGTGDNSGVGNRRGWEGGNSSIIGVGLSITALGGGGGASNHDRADNPALRSGVGSGGGGSGGANNNNGSGYGGSQNGFGTAGQGFNGAGAGPAWYPGGGGGAGGAGQNNSNNNPKGGIGVQNNITGTNYYWAGGGGGAGYSQCGGEGGEGGGGGGSPCTPAAGTGGLNIGQGGQGGGTSTWANTPGGNAGANTGGGGGGGAHYNSNNRGGYGGSGIVVVRVKG